MLPDRHVTRGGFNEESADFSAGWQRGARAWDERRSLPRDFVAGGDLRVSFKGKSRRASSVDVEWDPGEV